MATAKASGTFVQGWLAGAYSDAQWTQEFAAMREAGIDKLIIQSTVDETSAATAPPSYAPTSMLSLYPSNIPGVNYRGDTPGTGISPVESILRHAEANSVKVYLGLNFYGSAWFYDFDNRPFVTDTNWGDSEAGRGNAIADELVGLYQEAFPNAFAGWYWPWEIDNSAAIVLPSTQSDIARMLNGNLDHLAGLAGGLPVILSPFFNPSLGSPADGASFWTSLLSQLNHFGASGIFAPQDGIGAGNVSLGQLAPWFSALQGAVGTNPGATFWANCETFMGSGHLVTAPVERVIQQFQAVAPYVSDIVTFSYSHYDSPLQAPASVHAAWVAYANSI